SAARTKNCQGWKVSPDWWPTSDGRRALPGSPPPAAGSGFSRALLIEIPELIVKALVDRRIDRSFCLGCVGGRHVRSARPPLGREADNDDSGHADKIRKQPRESIEASIDGRAEKLLTAVEPREIRNDLITILALLD